MTRYEYCMECADRYKKESNQKLHLLYLNLAKELTVEQAEMEDW